MCPCSPAAAVRHAVLLAMYDDRERGTLRSQVEYRALFPGFEEEVDAALALLAGAPADVAPPAQDGERIGRYALITELGRGGQGVVYLAEDEELARRVALKVLAPRFALDPRCAERFRREAVAASRLAHPGVCAVHDVGEAGGLPYLAMEYLEGETLARRLARAEGRAPEREELRVRVRLVEEAARAVDAVHAAGVLHRDLKPSNLFVRASGAPVVLDFGLAHDEGQPVSLTLSGDVFGTPAYMAPEQIEGRRGAVGPWTDVYALGAVLHECLTGARPFQEPTRRALYRAILFVEPESPRARNPRVSRELALVTLKALAKEPRNRYASAGELADELQRVREHRPVRARVAGPLLRLRRWCRRDPWLAATAFALVAALLGSWAVTDSLARRTRRAELETLRDTDRQSAELLAQEVDGLWPVLPEGVAAMDAWLAEAGALRARWEDPTRADPALRAALESLPGRMDEVRARRAAALAIELESIEGHRAEWDATIAALADRSRNPVYGGLQLAPQVGLVPLGKDPASGLFEFAHLQSGAIPARDSRTGRLTVTEEMGLVFVLIPGGRFYMGAGSGQGQSSPRHLITLDPYFLSKFEMTQGQWLRVRGANPSEYAPGRSSMFGNSAALSEFDLRHPVERVSLLDCTETARRFGLLVPTEAQWECAARAGTTSAYWSGREFESLIGVANVYDRSRALAGDRIDGLELDFDDGFCFHAPVGSLAANPFGLHDVCGNVWEWVRDPFLSYANPVRAGDGERLGSEATTFHIIRGGSYGDRASYSRSATRYRVEAEGAFATNGFRPARAIRAGAAGRQP